MAEASPSPDRDAWRREMMRIGDAGGFYRELGAEHSALHLRGGDTLVVTFENLDHVLDHAADRLPWGFGFVRAQGWSILGLMAHGWTWYRDAAVLDFFDRLRDDGFFDDFRRVVFYGASMGGYAAAAFSAACPGATVIAISPQATLDRETTPWETRYSRAWGRDFRGRYGFAPDGLRAAGRVHLLYDPMAPLDRAHAALFDRPGVTLLRCPMMGHRIASAMQGMGILKPVIEAAIDGRLDPGEFHALLRKRRDLPRYYKEMLALLERRNDPWLTYVFCRHYLSRWRGPRFRAAMNAARATLEAEGRRLPGPAA
ncbi:phosphoadenosine phosphosulfate reductase [Rhodovulum strictum]|uniref:Phosphoadenosine phosphosulfate reductase n=1 Tax=Rhodovulum strictum TaxID=58314 RepID=A0A844BHV6_9RHOB|nr:phosphoadenosine phosphosulfate reductase [Rhodovulum strictum]MRH20632.1 phosphoadenosine phosphosulfate reductase [Rhodovulum strictum]